MAENKDKVRQATQDNTDLKPGLTVVVHQRIKETNSKGEEKSRVQTFEGMIIGVRKANTNEGTFTIRKVSSGVGVEKVIPFKSPNLVKIEIKKKAKVRQAKLGFIRSHKKRLKEKKVS